MFSRQLCYLAVMVLALTQQSIAQTYTITDLGPGEATGINNLGQVVGNDETVGARAYLWDARKGHTYLGTLGGRSVASAINDRGQVVGHSFVTGGFDPIISAFIWDASQGMRDLGALPGHRVSKAHSINKLGFVVGESARALLNDPQAVVWDFSGQVLPLGSMSGRTNIAFAVNDAFQVVGRDGPLSIGGNAAFIWKDGEFRDLGALEEEGSVAFAINNRGEVGGISYVAIDQGGGTFVLSRPILYAEQTGMRELAWEAPPGFDFWYGRVTSLSNRGQAAGSLGALVQEGFGYRFIDFAAVWDPVQGWRNLNDHVLEGSGWDLRIARDINDAGQIVGSGLLNGRRHAFLLTPNNS